MEQLRMKRGELKAKKEAARAAREKATQDKKDLFQRMRELALSSLIGVAVKPLCDMALERTRENCKNNIEGVKAKIKEHNGDISKFAAYPARNLPHHDRVSALSYRNFVHTLIESIEGSYKSKMEDGCHSGDYTYKISKAKCDKYIKQSEDATFDFYVSFVQKLNRKVGECTKAQLIDHGGGNVWGLSVLQITKPDGTKENWKTQIILNCSVLGNVFNQWPTRKVK